MKKRILIPTDFSQNAYNAIKYAMELYKEDHCEFFILHTYYLQGYSKENLLNPKPSDKELQVVKERAENNLEQLKVQMNVYETNDNHTFHYMNKFGSFFETLKKAVNKEAIELIIMGTKGETDSQDVVLGNSAVNIMEKNRNCPVLAIPGSVVYKAPNEIVFPTGFSMHYKEKELSTLIDISRLTNAPIRILHIYNGKELTKAQLKNKAMLDSFLESAMVTHHKLYDVDLQDGVRCFVESRQSEMIAIINKKHNFFNSIFSNPMLKELGKHARVPLLAMHDLKN